MMKSSQPTDPESGDTLFHSRQFSAIFTLNISNPSFSESSPRHREHRNRVCVRDPLPDHGQRDAAELHQVRGARHPHLGVPQLLHPPRPLPREKVQKNLLGGGLQILQKKVRSRKLNICNLIYFPYL